MWDDFKQRHLLDPSTDSGYTYWTRDGWNNWFRNRLPEDYGNKNINSIIISSPQGILDDFSELKHGYSKDDFWWSNSKFQIYVLKKTYNNDYDVVNIGQMYFLAKLDEERRPIHFHAQYMDRIRSGNANLSFKNYPQVS